MITGFTIILEDEILYCSDDIKYNLFEIVLFVEKLISSINPRYTWRLNKICLKDQKNGRERIIVKHIVTEKQQNLFFCIVGKFNVNSLETLNIVNEFTKQVNIQYRNLTSLKYSSEESTFKEIMDLIVTYLMDKYIEPLEEEIIFDEKGNNIKNVIIYAGISSQGLPLFSELCDPNLLMNLTTDKSNENIELFSSDLSAKLETIAMNAQIRAKSKIKEIHINDVEDPSSKIIILFGNINGYSLDFIASGNFHKIQAIFKQFKAKMSKDTIFEREFSGDLKPFKHLKHSLNEIIQIFDSTN
ncbi:MAG: hypothetical protein KGD65_02635 [Candidatus Lokiarchaeota archaeon]|nr:hypothetical protein [Candidatus Lokiarchaeota archaeon]